MVNIMNSSQENQMTHEVETQEQVMPTQEIQEPRTPEDIQNIRNFRIAALLRNVSIPCSTLIVDDENPQEIPLFEIIKGINEHGSLSPMGLASASMMLVNMLDTPMAGVDMSAYTSLAFPALIEILDIKGEALAALAAAKTDLAILLTQADNADEYILDLANNTFVMNAVNIYVNEQSIKSVNLVYRHMIKFDDKNYQEQFLNTIGLVLQILDEAFSKLFEAAEEYRKANEPAEEVEAPVEAPVATADIEDAVVTPVKKAPAKKAAVKKAAVKKAPAKKAPAAK